MKLVEKIGQDGCGVDCVVSTSLLVPSPASVAGREAAARTRRVPAWIREALER